MGDEDLTERRWSVGARAHTAFSDFPAPLARDLRDGGPMHIVVPGAAEGGQNLRYILDLPASGEAIDQTLGACGRPVHDPRDLEIEQLNPEGLPRDVIWARQPQASYPSGSRVYTRGFATVTCMVMPDGRTRDCAVETEQPADGGFGRAILRAMPAARLANRAGGPVPPTLIAFRSNFQIDESVGPSPRTRLR